MPIFYECDRCTACCRWPGEVRLSDGEIARLAAFRGMDEHTFIQLYTRLSSDRRGLSLLNKPNGECVFLENHECSVQPVKPQQCRDFPNLWNFPGFQETCRAIPRRVSSEEYAKLIQAATGRMPDSIPPVRPDSRVEFVSQAEAISGEGGWIEFRSSAIHGQGGFARSEIAAGVRLLEYRGEKIDKAESLRRCVEGNTFIFFLDETFDLNGDVPGNPARLLNHSCSPNCEAAFIEGHIWILSKRLVHAGEEITFNYGYDLTEYRDHPCSCGSPECAGYIVAEEFLPHVRPK